MEENEQSAVQAYKEEVRVQRMLKVLEYQVSENASIAAACEATGLAESTFHAWNKKGYLADYLATVKSSRVSLIQSQSALALPDVMTYMIRLATGQVVARGASPIRAAEIVMKMAGVSGAGRDPIVETNINILNLQPQLAVFSLEGGRPTLDDQGHLVEQPEIIEGEAVEL